METTDMATSKRVELTVKRVTDQIEAAIADPAMSMNDLLKVYDDVEEHLDACRAATAEDIARRMPKGGA